MQAFASVSLISRASDSELAFRRAAELADDATSASERYSLYPGTEVPVEVMNYLVEERHGVNQHIPLRFRSRMGPTVKSKVDEMLRDDRTIVSSFSYYESTYFITPASSYLESAFPAWNYLLAHPDLPAHVIQPILVTRVRRTPGTRGPAAENFEFTVLCIRSTASEDDKEQFIRSFQKRRNYLTTLHQMLRRVP